jgi:hypothetical protein
MNVDQNGVMNKKLESQCQRFKFSIVPCCGVLHEEDSSILPSTVVRTQIRRLQRGLADQGDEDAGQTGEQELASAKLLEEECAKDVAGKCARHPQGCEEEGHKACHSKGDVKDDSVVSDDQNTGELIVPHEQEPNECATSVGCGLEELEFGGGGFDLAIMFDLLLHPVIELAWYHASSTDNLAYW